MGWLISKCKLGGVKVREDAWKRRGIGFVEGFEVEEQGGAGGEVELGDLKG